jgi:predicted regulator of Ras-like GTPase activity (Roadblock/LC7/MglB family)
MNNEVCSFALKSTLNEIQNVCPDVSNSFIFKLDGKILAKNETTTEKTVNHTIDAFDAITQRADTIGGLETVTIQGANGRVNIACINDFYLTTIASKEADEKYVNTLTRVLIPIVIKLVEKIHPASTDDGPLATVDPEPVEDNATEVAADDAEDGGNEPLAEETATTELNEEQEQSEPEFDPEPLLPDPPVTQLIVENLGGLLVPSDTVRIDNEVITYWNNLYGDVKINEVDVEALNGKTTRCKVKQIKKSKDAGKGIIKMPEKIQLTLETTKGELVMVKPAVE